MDTAAVRRVWADVLAALSQLKRATWSLVSQHAQVLEFDGSRLLLGFATPTLTSSFTRGAHQEFLRQALIEAVALDCSIEAVTSEGRSAGGAGGPAISGHRPRGAVCRTPTRIAPKTIVS